MPHPAITPETWRRQAESLAARFDVIAQALADHPELAGEEETSSRLLMDWLREEGLTVETPWPVPHSFRAATGVPHEGRVALLAEYDALPGLGHACGHNLIGTASCLAAILVHRLRPDLAGRFEVIGTPAEEAIGGKIGLIEAGAFAGIGAAMLAHPAGWNDLPTQTYGMSPWKVRFRGRAAHAAAEPWEGRNALDALLTLFQGVGLMRQQLKDGLRIHGIVTQGGAAPNIVPEWTEGYFYLRAKTLPDLSDLIARFHNLAKGAALMHGCTVAFEQPFATYEPLRANATLNKVFEQEWRATGVDLRDLGAMRPVGSTDMGNVSQRLPAIHPSIKIAPEDFACHTSPFAEAVRTPGAVAAMVDAAVALARTAVRLLDDPQLMLQMWREHEEGA
ncbi:MAG: amidohydrolase [Alphaproteobacteria bacterium CG_4_10_14_0_2_um_filter_63_37]|nr:MAG: hypothetical protein AUJ55_07005 [Proteobacteria bacterium CG1_02_64_396]PJA24854.1 MAG: amidohydrolase [Alphaproteobacteria bacterium CG_4_10_14_0_2_um_filter_63_37]